MGDAEGNARAGIEDPAVKTREPLKAGFLTNDLSNLAAVRLRGSRCQRCGVSLLGERLRCENCSSVAVSHETFASTGRVYSYTIQRFAPPEPHELALPWAPRPIAWIDVDGGPRILSAVGCDPDHISIGMRVELRCDAAWLNDHGQEVVDYSFVPAKEASA